MRQTVLVGRIGPAFNGAEIIGHGSAAMSISADNMKCQTLGADYVRTVRRYALNALMQSIAENMTQYDAYRFDVATNDGVFR